VEVELVLPQQFSAQRIASLAGGGGGKEGRLAMSGL